MKRIALAITMVIIMALPAFSQQLYYVLPEPDDSNSGQNYYSEDDDYYEEDDDGYYTEDQDYYQDDYDYED